MEELALNPVQSGKPEGVLVFNPTQYPQLVDVRLPKDYVYEGRHLAANRFKFQQNNTDTNWNENVFGQVEVPAFGWRKVPLKELKKIDSPRITVDKSFIESEYYKLEFEPETGRIIRLFDKQRNWEMFDQSSEWTLFQFVQERVDPLHHLENRAALFPRDVEKGNNNISCWNHEWKALRRGATRLIQCTVNKHESGATLLTKWEGPGVDGLEQKVTLFWNRPEIEFWAGLRKQDIRIPESIYFTFPLNLEKWRATFDSAGTFVELDKQQLPGACKDWVTVDNVVSVYDQDKGVTLACPDAPLVQIGDFNFGKEQKSIPRNERPLLLAWPMNNYWDTNFCATQPGFVSFKYVLSSFATYSSSEARSVGALSYDPVQVFPAVHCDTNETGVFLETDNSNVAIVTIKAAEDTDGMIVRLLNLSEDKRENVTLTFPNQVVTSAAVTDVVENKCSELPYKKGHVFVQLSAKSIVTVNINLD